MAVVRMEQPCRRGQPWRRWKNSDDSPLPRLDWTDGEVEKVEKTTARLQVGWATRFRGGERARRRRRAVGNGGRLLWLGAARGEGERKSKWRGECVGQARGVLLSRPAAPGGTRRVAACLGDRRRTTHTRRAFSEIGQSL